jgi:hypothetical protein
MTECPDDVMPIGVMRGFGAPWQDRGVLRREKNFGCDCDYFSVWELLKRQFLDDDRNDFMAKACLFPPLSTDAR